MDLGKSNIREKIQSLHQGKLAVDSLLKEYLQN